MERFEDAMEKLEMRLSAVEQQLKEDSDEGEDKETAYLKTWEDMDLAILERELTVDRPVVLPIKQTSR